MKPEHGGLVQMIFLFQVWIIFSGEPAVHFPGRVTKKSPIVSNPKPNRVFLNITPNSSGVLL